MGYCITDVECEVVCVIINLDEMYLFEESRVMWLIY